MQKTIYIYIITFFFSFSAFANIFDEYGYNNSSYGSPMYNTGAMGGGTYWSAMATAFYSQMNPVVPYSYLQTMETKVQTSDQGVKVVGDRPASTPNTVVKKDEEESRATGWDVYWIYPATTITSTRENTVSNLEANISVINTYGPNTLYNFNVYDIPNQRYIYNTYKATSNGPILMSSGVQASPPPGSIPYSFIPRSENSSFSSSSQPGPEFYAAIQLYNKETLTIPEASRVVIDYIDKVIPDETNGRILFMTKTIGKVINGLPTDQKGNAANLLKEYMTAEVSMDLSDQIADNNFPENKNNIFTSSGEPSGRNGLDGYELQLEIEGVLEKPSSLDRSQSSLNTLVKIVALYAKSKGFHGTVVVTNREGPGRAYYANGVLTVRKSAFEIGLFDNVNNLKSAIDHEIGHFNEPADVVANYQFKDHFAIYLLQASLPDFKNTTEGIKISNANEYMNRVLNAATAHEVGMNDAGILQAVTNYNTKNKGGIVISNVFYAGSYAGLSFKTTINGVEKYNGFSYKLLAKKTD